MDNAYCIWQSNVRLNGLGCPSLPQRYTAVGTRRTIEMSARYTLVAAATVMLGCGPQYLPEGTPLPDLRARRDGCAVPEPRVALSARGESAPGQLRVDVRSTQDSTWRGEVSMRAVGPLEGRVRDVRQHVNRGMIAVRHLAIGRYVLWVGAVGHYPRVDTVSVGEGGLTLMMPLDPASPHWCGGGEVRMPSEAAE